MFGQKIASIYQAKTTTSINKYIFIKNISIKYIFSTFLVQVSLCYIITNYQLKSIRQFPSAETSTIQKPGNWFGMQTNWLVSIRYKSTPKGISEETILTRSLSTRYLNIIIIIKKRKMENRILLFIVLISLVLNYLTAHATDCHFLRNFVFLWGTWSAKCFSIS